MTSAPTRAGRKEWIGLVVLVLPCLLVSMDMSVLFFALPFLSADLTPSGSQLLWIMDIYGFMLAGLLITMGTLGDRIGRRRLLLAGAAAFGLASIIAAYSSSPEMLIAARALLGIGGATLAPSTLSLIRNMFHDPGQRRAAIGAWTAGFTGGAAVGPVIGGVMLEHFWWGSVFLINVPVMVLLVALAPVLVPEFRDPSPGRFDIPSALLSLAAVLPVIYGIKKIAEDLAFSPGPAAAIVAGLLVGAVFIRRQRRLADPMIDVRLFSDRAFSASIAVMTATIFGLVGIGLFSSQYLQTVLGMGPLEAALWSLPPALLMPVGITLGSLAVKKVRPAFVVGAGLLVTAAGLVVVSRTGVTDGLATVVGGSVMMTIGIGAVVVLATDMVLAAAPPERAGAASAMSETANEFGGALGIALIGSVGTLIYRNGMDAADLAAVPAEAVEAAKDTVGAAVAIGQDLPAGVGAPLIQAAHEAFTDGFNAGALSGAAVVTVAALAAVVALRSVRLGDVQAAGAQAKGSPDPTDAVDASQAS